jgi:DNA helicase-2/ATP-dependent DNA helicase PcrA
MKLTDKQIEAVKSLKGNILVNASAGSGKTSVFATRMALLCKLGIEEERILGLTFSNTAATNMKKRLGKYIGSKRAAKIPMSTFHSFAYKTLKEEFDEYNHIQIMPLWWKLNTLRAIAKDMCIEGPKVTELAEFISRQKTRLVRRGEDVLDEDQAGMGLVTLDERKELYDAFREEQANARQFEFDDMLLDFYYHLKDDPAFAEKMRDKFDYVMVDEYQDTPYINNQILQLMTKDNLFCVGDFRQGIYGFINADINNILEFEKTFNNPKVIELQDNFRSTKNIVDFSNAIIRKSPVQSYKRFSEGLAARGIIGQDVDLTAYKDTRSETDGIVSAINKKVNDDGMKYSDFAILLRTNSHLGDFEDRLTEFDIPASVSSGKSFFDKNAVQDMMAYLKLCQDPNDNNAFRRVINRPTRYVTHKFTSELDKIAYRLKKPLIECVGNVKERPGKISNLVILIQRLHDVVEEKSPKQLLEEVVKKTDYLKWIQNTKTAIQFFDEKDTVESFIDFAGRFASIPELLNRVSIILRNGKKKEKEAVQIMTVHASKGMEFECVYGPSILEENYPHEMCDGNIEEERRLFYVLSSRAKNELHLSYPVYVGKGKQVSRQSPFLLDVTGSLKELNRPVFRGKNESKMAIKC